MTEPPQFDPGGLHVLKGATGEKIRRSILERTPLGSNTIKATPVADGVVLELRDRKTAILPLDLGGGVEWVVWTCVEGDQARFRIVRDVGPEGWQLEPEMMESCEPGSVELISAMPLGGLAWVTAEVVGSRVEVDIAPLPGQTAQRARLVIEGVRKGMPERWARSDEQTARRNAEFWASAHQVEDVP